MKKILFLPLLTSLFLVGCNGLLGENENSDSNDQFAFDELDPSSTNNSDNSGKVINDDSESVTTKYQITFVNDDGSTLKTFQVEAGKKPVLGYTPTKESSQQYDYTFSHWEPSIYAANKDQTYVAKYSSTIRQYEVAFYSNNGKTRLDTQYVNYGSRPTYKQQNDNGNNLFVGYSTVSNSSTPTITKTSDFPVVTKNDSYYAVYQIDPNTTFQLTFYLSEQGSSGAVRSIDVKVNTTPDFATLFPNDEVKCTTYPARSDFQYYIFEDWYAGYLSKDNMLGGVEKISSKSKIGLKPVTQNTVYYPVFKKVSLIKEYPDGYATYKENENSQEYKVLTWDYLKTNQYISVSNKVLTPNINKLSTLKSLYLAVGNSVTSIVDDAFSGLSNLKYIYLDDNITTLGKRCFKNTGLETIYNSDSLDFWFFLPEKLTVIPENIFDGVNIFRYIYAGNSLTSVETNAFYGAGGNNFNDILFEVLEQYSYSQISNILKPSWYGNKSLTLICSDNNYTFPN